MNEFHSLSQVNHESSDSFKAEVLFPMVATEIHDEVGLLQKKVALLELGAGSGTLANALAPLKNSIEEVILVDINDKVLPVAKDTYKSSGIDCSAIAGSVNDILPIEKGSVDVCVSSFLLNQLRYPELCLELSHHYLSPEGKLIVIVPDEAFIHRISQETDKLSQGVKGVLHRTNNQYRLDQSDYDVPFYSRPNTDYSRIMGMVGFSVNEWRVVDSKDTMMGVDTPKALMLVGRKIADTPGRSGEKSASYVEDSIDKVTANAVIQSEADSTSHLIATLSNGEQMILPIPLREDSDVVLNKLMKVISGDEINQLIIKKILIKSSEGRKNEVVRMYHNSEMFAYYSYEFAGNF